MVLLAALVLLVGMEYAVRWYDLIKFLRAISRTTLGEQEAEFIRQFCQRDVPWDNLAALAQMQGVAGLLYLHLKAMSLHGMLPHSFAEQIVNTYRQTKQHTLAIAAEAKALSVRLEEAGIPVVALQGLSILSVYGDPGLRELGDADLLVKPVHKQLLKMLLWEAGYRMPTFMYSDLLCKDGIWIDIHTHILNLERIQSRSYLFPEDLTSMWERAMPFSDQSDGLLLLDPYDNFIALAAHALKHSYSRLIWLVDLHESLLEWAKDSNGWKDMVARAQLWRQEKVVLYGLILMERIFNLNVPLWVKKNLGIQKLNILEKHLLRLKLRGFSSNELCIGLWLCNIKGTKRKLKFIGETVFPRREIMAQLFPQAPSRKMRIVYVQRILNALILLGSNLRQVLTFSFRKGCNR